MQTLFLGPQFSLWSDDLSKSLAVWNNGSSAVEQYCYERQIKLKHFWRHFDVEGPSGNLGRICLPWYEREQRPDSLRPQVYRFGLEGQDESAHVRALLEGQALSLLGHHDWSMAEVLRVVGFAAQRPFAQLLSQVLGLKITWLELGKSSEGVDASESLRTELDEASLKMLGALDKKSKEMFSVGIKYAMSFEGDLLKQQLYANLLDVYRAHEQYILTAGANPEGLRCNFIRRWR